LIYIIIYLTICILTSIVLFKKDWLDSLYEYDIGDYILTGFASIAWFLIIPVILIGFIGDKIANKI